MHIRKAGLVGLAIMLGGLGVAACGEQPDSVTVASGSASQENPTVPPETDQFGRPADCPKDSISRGEAEETPLPTDVAGMAAGSDFVVVAKTNPSPTVTEMTVPKGQPQPFAGIPLTQTTVTVVETLRGAPSSELVVTQFGHRCTIGMPPILTPGATYVLFLYEAQPGVLYQFGRSAIFEVVGEDATTDDPKAPPQTLTLDELRSQVRS